MDICEGCESKKWKLLGVRVCVRARGIVLYFLKEGHYHAIQRSREDMNKIACSLPK